MRRHPGLERKTGPDAIWETTELLCSPVKQSVLQLIPTTLIDNGLYEVLVFDSRLSIRN